MAEPRTAERVVQILRLRFLIPVVFVTAIFSILHLHSLPGSDHYPKLSYESYLTHSSYILFAHEPWSFPVGKIPKLTYPFPDANIGNTGCIPIAAIFFKALGNIFPYFKTFYYFSSLEMISVFFSAFFISRIFLLLGRFRLLEHFAALTLILITPSLILRSIWQQPFVILSFPIFSIWIYLHLKIYKFPLQKHWICAAFLFPIAATSDFYAFVGICLASGIVILTSFMNLLSTRASETKKIFRNVLFSTVFGVLLSILTLYIIGMIPLPSPTHTFSSFEFGMGGGYHVADVFGFFIPPNARFLSPGQYEGTVYLGLGAVLVLLMTLASWTKNKFTLLPFSKNIPFSSPNISAIRAVFFAALFLLLYSWGYKIHVFGKPLDWIVFTPASLISEWFHPLYNIRAPGRLGIFPMMIITLGALWWVCQHGEAKPKFKFLLLGLMAIQIVDSVSLLKPYPSYSNNPVLTRYSEDDVAEIQNLSKNKTSLIIAPSVRDDVSWLERAYSLAVLTGLPSNIYYLARPVGDHELLTSADHHLVQQGGFNSLFKKYPNSLVAFPKNYVKNTLLNPKLKRMDLVEVTIVYE